MECCGREVPEKERGKKKTFPAAKKEGPSLIGGEEKKRKGGWKESSQYWKEN